MTDSDEQKPQLVNNFGVMKDALKANDPLVMMVVRATIARGRLLSVGVNETPSCNTPSNDWV